MCLWSQPHTTRSQTAAQIESGATNTATSSTALVLGRLGVDAKLVNPILDRVLGLVDLHLRWWAIFDRLNEIVECYSDCVTRIIEQRFLWKD